MVNLDEVEYHQHPVFGLAIPKRCPDVPNAILNPRDTWRNEDEYDQMAMDLAQPLQRKFQNL